MKIMFQFLAGGALALCLFSFANADEQGALRLIREHEAQMGQWKEQLKAAPNMETRRQLWQLEPDKMAFGKKLLREIDGSWDKPWFLNVAPRLIELAPQYALSPVSAQSSRTPLGVIRDSADKFHFENEKIGALALSLIIDNDPKTQKFLHKLESQHPSQRVQGQAAMALALLTRQLGAGGDVTNFKKQRLDWVRKAIIHAADVRIAGVTVGDAAKSFLFAITNLDKGMVAPEILGWNVEGEAMKLSDYRGKPVMLIFWHSQMESAEETLAFIRKIEARLGPKGLVVLGVAAEDKNTLRAWVKDGTITWKNWMDSQGSISSTYQVINYPKTWILDAKGKIAFTGVPSTFAELNAEALLK